MIISGTKQRPLCPVHGAAFVEQPGRHRPYLRCGAAFHGKRCDLTAARSPHDRLWRVNDQATARARRGAHLAFDQLWKAGIMRRWNAYAWLARTLGLSRAECHIAHLDEAACLRVAAECAAVNRAAERAGFLGASK